VEFAIIVNLFFLLFLGMVEFGLAFSMRQVIINASREGARYGVVFRVDAQGNRISPAMFSPTINEFILTTTAGGLGLHTILPANSNPTVSVGGAGALSGVTGDDLRVTVTCNYNFLVLNKLIPFFNDNLQLTATTVMRVE
jgi:Flp pilus assembly protein TadG